MRFEIHSHSMYSNLRLIDAICKPRDLIKTAYDLGLSGIVLTDHESLSGHIDFIDAYNELKESNYFQREFTYGLGNEIYLVDSRKDVEKYYHLILIAKNTQGHEALRKLSSIAWYNAYYSRGLQRVPTTKKELKAICEEYPNSLIISSACIGSEVAARTFEIIEAERRKDEELIYSAKLKLFNLIQFFKECVGDDFYLEVAPSASPDQKKYNKRIKEIAKSLGIKLVFGGDAHFLTAADRQIHAAFLNSKNGEREVDSFYHYAHLMTDNEAFENCGGVFTKEEFEEACANSLEIQSKISNYDLFRNPIIPSAPLPKLNYTFELDSSIYPVLSKEIKNGTQAARYWSLFCLNKLKEMDLLNEVYLVRLETEADVISSLSEKMGNDLFSYFTTFQSYIDLFWECGSIVGPGRGSAVAYLSNYLLGITQLDPIKNNLDYWRFLNKDRAELPDIDIDLTPSKRETIFSKIREQIGQTRLLQVATFSTAGARNAILAACRGYRSADCPSGIDVDVAQYLSSLIPQERGFVWPLSDVVNGNEEKDRKPIKEFVNFVSQYDGLLDIMLRIEGLVIGHSQHASGVIIYNQPCYKTGALMRSPKGALTTQFELHQGERVGDTKFDFLVTEICDKITKTIELLQADGLLPNLSLREVYNQYLHPDKLNLEDSRLWDALANGDVIDVFQFSTAVGLHAAQTIKPRNPTEMMMANALTRLVGEKGEEMPIDRYVRLKNDMSQWRAEIIDAGLTDDEIKLIEPYYLPVSGCPTTQEKLMLICMNVAHFSLKEANEARKIVSKKQVKKVPDLRDRFMKGCGSLALANYVWKTCMAPQMSYSFAEPHALSYSYVGIQVLYLATNFNRMYWNTAILISNSGGDEQGESQEEEDAYIDVDFNSDDTDDDDDDVDEDESEENKTEKVKKKTKTKNYGRMATAIGKIMQMGVKISPPLINESEFTFKPDVKNNTILYGLSGISKINADLVKLIIENRPYKSIDDFLARVKVTKPQMVNLIKCGAFDEFGNRDELMFQYINLISGAKSTLNLRNMKMLLDFKLIPEKYSFECKIFNFTKYLRTMKLSTDFYGLDNIAFEFYEKNCDMDLLIQTDETESGFKIEQKKWDKIYKKYMTVISDYIKKNLSQLLKTVNDKLTFDIWHKYCEGTISKWEMDSISCYIHPHELYRADLEQYGIDEFEFLPRTPEIDRYIPIKGKQIPLFKLHRIAGTVLDRDKAKKTVTLLTKSGVVLVKIYGGAFVNYDSQISERDVNGKKHVLRKSEFKRGNKIIITGLRNEDDFIAKKYKNTPWHLIETISNISENGELEINNRND